MQKETRPDEEESAEEEKEKQDCKALKKKSMSLDSQLLEYEGKLALILADISKQKKEKDKLCDTVTNCEKDRKERESRIKLLEVQVQQYSELRKRRREEEEELASLKNDINALSADCDALKETLDERNSEVSEQKEAIRKKIKFCKKLAESLIEIVKTANRKGQWTSELKEELSILIEKLKEINCHPEVEVELVKLLCLETKEWNFQDSVETINSTTEYSQCKIDSSNPEEDTFSDVCEKKIQSSEDRSGRLSHVNLTSNSTEHFSVLDNGINPDSVNTENVKFKIKKKNNLQKAAKNASVKKRKNDGFPFTSSKGKYNVKKFKKGKANSLLEELNNLRTQMKDIDLQPLSPLPPSPSPVNVDDDEFTPCQNTTSSAGELSVLPNTSPLHSLPKRPRLVHQQSGGFLVPPNDATLFVPNLSYENRNVQSFSMNAQNNSPCRIVAQKLQDGSVQLFFNFSRSVDLEVDPQNLNVSCTFGQINGQVKEPAVELEQIQVFENNLEIKNGDEISSNQCSLQNFVNAHKNESVVNKEPIQVVESSLENNIEEIAMDVSTDAPILQNNFLNTHKNEAVVNKETTQIFESSLENNMEEIAMDVSTNASSLQNNFLNAHKNESVVDKEIIQIVKNTLDNIIEEITMDVSTNASSLQNSFLNIHKNESVVNKEQIQTVESSLENNIEEMSMDVSTNPCSLHNNFVNAHENKSAVNQEQIQIVESNQENNTEEIATDVSSNPYSLKNKKSENVHINRLQEKSNELDLKIRKKRRKEKERVLKLIESGNCTLLIPKAHFTSHLAKLNLLKSKKSNTANINNEFNANNVIKNGIGKESLNSPFNIVEKKELLSMWSKKLNSKNKKESTLSLLSKSPKSSCTKVTQSLSSTDENFSNVSFVNSSVLDSNHSAILADNVINCNGAELDEQSNNQSAILAGNVINCNGAELDEEPNSHSVILADNVINCNSAELDEQSNHHSAILADNVINCNCAELDEQAILHSAILADNVINCNGAELDEQSNNHSAILADNVINCNGAELDEQSNDQSAILADNVLNSNGAELDEHSKSLSDTDLLTSEPVKSHHFDASKNINPNQITTLLSGSESVVHKTNENFGNFLKTKHKSSDRTTVEEINISKRCPLKSDCQTSNANVSDFFSIISSSTNSEIVEKEIEFKTPSNKIQKHEKRKNKFKSKSNASQCFLCDNLEAELGDNLKKYVAKNGKKSNSSLKNKSSHVIFLHLQFLESRNLCLPKHLKLYSKSFSNILTDSNNLPDIDSVLLYLLDYLSKSKKDSVLVPSTSGYSSIVLPCVEQCIIFSLCMFPNPSEILNTFLNSLYYIISFKEHISVSGLCALCRVFTETCKICKYYRHPILLSCQLLKVKHQYAPYLIASIIGVWPELYQVILQIPNKIAHDTCKILCSSIAYGVSESCKTLPKSQRQHFVPVLSGFLEDHSNITIDDILSFIQISISDLIDNDSFGEFDFILSSSLVILCAFEGLSWTKVNVFNSFLLQELKKYSEEVCNGKAFFFFCHIYTDILLLFPNEDKEHSVLMSFFLHSDQSGEFGYVKDTTGYSLLKLHLFRNRLLPKCLKDWLSDISADNNNKLHLLFRVGSNAQEKEISFNDILWCTNNFISSV